MNAAKRLELAGHRNPIVLELARWVSLSSRVDPVLLRAARLQFLPQSCASVEADLWFSPMVQVCSADAFQFFPDVAETLRQELRLRKGDFERASQLNRHCHANFPVLLRLEEELIYLALIGDDQSTNQIDQRLRPLLKALAIGERLGLARWVASVLPQLPQAGRTATAAVLQAMADSKLHGGNAILIPDSMSTLTDSERALLMQLSRRTDVGLRIIDGKVEISEPPTPGGRHMSLPDTNPRWLEFVSSGGQEDKTKTIVWASNTKPESIELTLPAEIRSAGGERFRVQSRKAALAEVSERAAKSILLLLGDLLEPLLPGLLIDGRHVVVGWNPFTVTEPPRLPSTFNRSTVSFRLSTGNFVSAKLVGRDKIFTAGTTTDDFELLVYRLNHQIEMPTTNEPSKVSHDVERPLIFAATAPRAESPDQWEQFRHDLVSGFATPLFSAPSNSLISWEGAIAVALRDARSIGILSVNAHAGFTTLAPMNLILEGVTHVLKRKRQISVRSVPRVFISSTVADLETYRAAAREAAIAVGMLPVMCGDFAPSDHRPPLDECLARVKETDVLIVLTAHRYGWIPDDQPKEKPRKSITWLECQQAVDNSCEVLGFLIGHDGEWAAEQKEDYRLIVAFKEKKLTAELQSDVEESVDGLAAFHQWLNSRGIRKKVQTPSELSTQIVLALKEWHERHPDFNQNEVKAGQAVTPDKYLAALLEQSSYIDIRGLAVGSGKAHRFPIEDLYISLNSRQPVRDQHQVSEKKRRGVEPESIDPDMLSDRHPGERSEVPLQAALVERRLVIIGDPGAGKTTFLRRIAAALCLTELGTIPQAAQSRLGIGDRTFPIVLRCALLADHIAKHLKNAGAPSDPASPAWLAHCLAAENVSGLDQAFFQRQLEDGRCTVMLDGLDEAPDPVRRANLSKLAENLSQTFACCRFVVTSRPPAYTGTVVLPQFSHVEIAPLTDDAIERFLEHWCGQLYGDKSPDALEHRKVLLDSLHARPEIRRVARNPVMLTALAVVHWNQRRLPEQRAELYDSVITWLSRSRESRPDRETPEKCVTLLQNLALAMHDHAEGRKTQVSKHWAAEHVLAKFFGPGDPTATSIAAAEKFLTEEELDSGIVVAAGNDVKFWHLQFQEYL
ncbi:MAG: DUF4062 domain-containing protein, partial [Schlesneria sp.]